MTNATASLAELFEDTPEELRRQALSHSSWVEKRTESYGRLAFLGDSVLGLSVATLIFQQDPNADIEFGLIINYVRDINPKETLFCQTESASCPNCGEKVWEATLVSFF